MTELRVEGDARTLQAVGQELARAREVLEERVEPHVQRGRDRIVVLAATAREPRVEGLARLRRQLLAAVRDLPPQQRIRRRDLGCLRIELVARLGGPRLRTPDLADREVARDPDREAEQTVLAAVVDEPRRDLPHPEQRLLE